jgi:flagellar assembly protein FliH
MDAIIRAATVSATARPLRRASGSHANSAAVDVVLSAPAVSAPATPIELAPTLNAAAAPPAVAVEVTLSEAQRLMAAHSEAQTELRRQREEYQAELAQLASREQQLAEREQRLKTAQQQLNEQAEAVLENARERGHALGLSEGENEGNAQVASQLERLNSMVGALNQTRRTLQDENEDMLVEIAFAAVCRMIGATQSSRDGVVAMVQALLGAERDPSQLCVRLHPADLALLSGAATGLDGRINLQADASIEIGGCLIETARGTLDARLELQLQHLRAALLAARELRGKNEVPV